MNYIWISIILISIIFGVINGNSELMVEILLDTPKSTLEMLINIGGLIIFYNGLFKMAIDSGVINKFSKYFIKIIHLIFPEIPKDHIVNEYICCNYENYILEVIQTGWVNLDINSIISYAVDRIKKRKKKFGLYIRTKRYTSFGEAYDKQFIENGYECVQNQILLTNSSAKVIKEQSKSGKYTVIGDFCPSNIMPV